jgi:hypothetical protein
MERLPDFGHLSVETFSPIGETPLLLHDASAPERAPRFAINLALDRPGLLPALDHGAFDALITTCPAAPAPWATVRANRFDAQVGLAARACATAPIAAVIALRVAGLSRVSVTASRSRS